MAIAHRRGPSALILRRQMHESIRRTAGSNRGAAGAFLLAEAESPRAVTILATRTEVALAMRARAMLAKEGIAVAVISRPSWALFEQQPRAVGEAILSPAPRIGLEAAVRLGWDR